MPDHILEAVEPLGEHNNFITADPGFVFIRARYQEEIGSRPQLCIYKVYRPEWEKIAVRAFENKTLRWFVKTWSFVGSKPLKDTSGTIKDRPVFEVQFEI